MTCASRRTGRGRAPDGRGASRMTRRELLALLGAGAAAATGIPAHADVRAQNQVGAAKLSPFPLQDVRLLDGPFLDAQRRDLAYLLSLEPDRMLHNFRVNAGLEPKAPVYGGWESEEPWVDIRCHGHTLGHYLSAASHDVRLDRRRADERSASTTSSASCRRASRRREAGWCARFPTAPRSSRTPWRAGGSSACPGTRCTRSSRACATRTSTPGSAAGARRPDEARRLDGRDDRADDRRRSSSTCCAPSMAA